MACDEAKACLSDQGPGLLAAEVDVAERLMVMFLLWVMRNWNWMM